MSEVQSHYGHNPGGIISTPMPPTPGVKTELDLWALVSGFPNNLRYVHRWACSRCLRPENVAEHTFYVSFYAMLIADWCLRNDRIEFPLLNLGSEFCPRCECPVGGPDTTEVLACQKQAFVGVVLMKAMVHDVEEARTGDIHRPFKHSTIELKAALSAAADVAAQQFFEQLFPLEDIQVDGSASLSWLNFWSNAKDQSFAGAIVRFADYLSVLSYVLQEGPDATLRLCLDSMEGQFEELRHSNWDFIRPLIEAAARLSKEVFVARKQAVNPG